MKLGNKLSQIAQTIGFSLKEAEFSFRDALQSHLKIQMKDKNGAPYTQHVFRKRGLTISYAARDGVLLGAIDAALDHDGGRQVEGGRICARPKIGKRLISIAQARGKRGDNDPLDTLEGIALNAIRMGGPGGLLQLSEQLQKSFMNLELTYDVPGRTNRDRPLSQLAGDYERVCQGLLDKSRDALTGQYRKDAIYRNGTVKEINRQVHGARAMVVMDFNHVRVANDLGQRDALNQLLATVKLSAAAAFGMKGLTCELVRVGGDEMALVFQHAHGWEDALAAFKEMLDQNSELLFSSKSAKVANAHATLREEVRKDRATWSPLKIKRDGPVGIQAAFRANQRRVLGTVAFSDVLLMGDKEHQPRDYVIGRDQLDASLQRNKTDRAKTRIVSLNPSFKLRAASVQSLKRSERIERRKALHHAELLARSKHSGPKAAPSIDTLSNALELARQQATDPSVNNSVARYEHLIHCPLKDILPINETKKISVLKFDVQGFGILNHIEGADRADEILAAFAGIIGGRYPDCRLVRKDGGGIYAVFDRELDLQELSQFNSLPELLRLSLSLRLPKHKFTQASLEFRQEQRLKWLRNALKAENVRDRFGNITTQHYSIEVAPDDTAESMFAKLS